MPAFTPVGVEAQVRNLGGFLRGLGQMDSAIQSTGNTAGSIGKQFTGLGNSVLKVGGIAGAAAVGGVAALTAGFTALGISALGEIAKFERMGLSITNLVAREISGGKVIEQETQKRIQLSEKEQQELAKLPGLLDKEQLSRNTLAARIQEQRQRVIDLTASYGENGLAVITAKARLAEMEGQLGDTDNEIARMQGRIKELNADNGRLVTTLEKVRVGQISMSEALEQASPRAQELIKWIQLLGIQSPFSSEGIQAAFQTALAYGFTTEQAQRLTKAEVDFTAATGKSAESADLIALALGQIQARGKLSAQELRQLSEQGIGVNRILEDMGFSLDDVTNGLVPVDDFMEAVIKDMEVFEGAAKRQSTTFSGLIESLGEVKSIGLRDFFTGTFEAIRPYLSNFVEFLTKAAFETGSIKKLGDALGQKVGKALQKISEFTKVIQAGGLAVFSKYLGVEGIPLWYQLQELIGNISASLASLGGLFAANLSGPISDFTSNIVPMITQGIMFINQHFAEFKGALIGIGAVLAGAAFTAIVAGLLSLLSPINLIIAAAALLGAAWAGNWGDVQGKTAAVWAVIQPVLQQVYNWLATNLPVAIGVLSQFWTTTLLPAMMAVGTWITGTFIPTMIQVWTWLSVNVPAAIQTLSGFWTDTLLPAISAVIGYAQNVAFPFWMSLANLLSAVVGIAVKALAGLWQNVLGPALMVVIGLIVEKLSPGFEAIAKIISERVTPVTGTLSDDILPALSKGLQTVVKWIKEATKFFNDMANAINSVKKLPDWLKPGSPPPLAYALMDIASAANQAAGAMQSFSRVTALPADTLNRLLGRPLTGFAGFNNVLGAAADFEEKFLEKRFSRTKSKFILTAFKKSLRDNWTEFIGPNGEMTQAAAGFMENAVSNWEKAGISGGQIRAAASKMVDLFNEELRKQKLLDLAEIGKGLGIAGQFAQFGQAAADRLQSRIDILQQLTEAGGGLFEGQTLDALQAQEMLNQALEDQASVQQQIIDLQRQQADLQFLQQQLNLIKLIQEQGLNVKDILGGITLGLNASLPDIVTAMNNVVQAMIGQLDESLQIGSPSKVLMDKFKQVGLGAVKGLLATKPLIERAFMPIIQPLLETGGSSSSVTNNNYNLTFPTSATPQGVVQQFHVARTLID